MQFRRDRGPPDGAELRFEQLHDVAHDVVQVHRVQFGLRHLREIAEAGDDGLQIFDFRDQNARGLAKHFVELARAVIVRGLQILHGRLQGEQRILQLVREAARQFAPCGDALRLHEAFALLDQLLGHAIECFRELADFIFAVTGTRAFQFPSETSRAPSPIPAPARVTRVAAHQLTAKPKSRPASATPTDKLRIWRSSAIAAFCELPTRKSASMSFDFSGSGIA